ncbi:MAG: sigma-70 family RNA polymerase sigma factor [Chloroflexota bacterium]
MHHKQHPETNLVKALRRSQHDLSAFTPIYEAYVDRIYSYCLYRVNHVADAEDLTSQIFARAMVRCETFRGDSVGAWLFRIAYHMTIDHYRAKRTDTLSDEQLAILHDASQPSPLESVIRGEEVNRLHNLLKTLDEDKRNLLLLHITGDLTAREVGDIVGKSSGAVRVEIHRIIQHLKQQALLQS